MIQIYLIIFIINCFNILSCPALYKSSYNIFMKLYYTFCFHYHYLKGLKYICISTKINNLQLAFKNICLKQLNYYSGKIASSKYWNLFIINMIRFSFTTVKLLTKPGCSACEPALFILKRVKQMYPTVTYLKQDID